MADAILEPVGIKGVRDRLVRAGQGPGSAADEVRARATVHRRRLARQGGFGLRDCDAVTRERIMVWSIALAGWERVDPAADPETYWRGANVVNRALAAVEARLRELGLDRRESELDRHLRERYGVER